MVRRWAQRADSSTLAQRLRALPAELDAIAATANVIALGESGLDYDAPTDAPWLAPVPYRGKPNQPAWVTQNGALSGAAAWRECRHDGDDDT